MYSRLHAGSFPEHLVNKSFPDTPSDNPSKQVDADAGLERDVESNQARSEFAQFKNYFYCNIIHTLQ
jgi:hypothetical protein